MNVLNAVKMVPRCAAWCDQSDRGDRGETEQGRGILGVVDGSPPKGVEDEEGVRWRKGLLRQIGYKL